MSDKRRPLKLNLDGGWESSRGQHAACPILALPLPSSGQKWRSKATGEGHKERTVPSGHIHVSVCKEDTLLPSFQGGLSSLNHSSQRLPCMEHELRWEWGWLQSAASKTTFMPLPSVPRNRHVPGVMVTSPISLPGVFVEPGLLYCAS